MGKLIWKQKYIEFHIPHWNSTSAINLIRILSKVGNNWFIWRVFQFILHKFPSFCLPPSYLYQYFSTVNYIGQVVRSVSKSRFHLSLRNISYALDSAELGTFVIFSHSATPACLFHNTLILGFVFHVRSFRNIQLCRLEMAPLLSKHYWNEVYLTGQNLT